MTVHDKTIVRWLVLAALFALMSGNRLSFAQDVNATDKNGHTQLHKAASQGQTEAAEKLIARGANINAKDGDGNTPLHYAADETMAALLIAKGANIDAKNSSGITPLHFFAMVGQKDIVELLMDTGVGRDAYSFVSQSEIDAVLSAKAEDRPKALPTMKLS